MFHQGKKNSGILENLSVKKYSIFAVLFLGIFILFTPPFDADFGWHLRLGELIWITKELPRENIFSFTFPDYNWANSYWLSETIIYLLSLPGSVVSVSLVLSFLFSLLLIYFFYFVSDFADFRIALFPLTFFLLALVPYKITVRPLFFSSMFLLLLVFVLLNKKKYMSFLPILFLFWANMHADFVLGLIVFGFFILELLLKGRLNIYHLFSFFASVLATLVNPFGIFLHLTLLKESHPLQFQYIQEWRPVWESSPHILFFMSVIFFGMLLSWKKHTLGIKIACIVLFMLSLRFGYFSRIFILVCLFPMSAVFIEFLNSLKKTLSPLHYKATVLLMRISLLVIFLFITLRFFNNFTMASTPGYWEQVVGYPVSAVKHIKTENLKGNIFNYYGWGGYLILSLPENKVFIDGRMPSWRVGNRSILEDYISLALNPSDNTYLLTHYIQVYDINMALLKRESSLVTAFLSQGWEIDFTDDASILLKKP